MFERSRGATAWLFASALSISSGAAFSACSVGHPGHGNLDSGVGFDEVDLLDPGSLLDTDGGSIDPGGGIPDPCSDAAKLVYVVDESNMLASFDPGKLKFTDIGLLMCPAQLGATPFSMGIDRSATAWVLYSSGELFEVDTANAKCKATTFKTNDSNFTNFGMGFASDMLNSNMETLFVAGTNGGVGLGSGTLGTLDLKTFKLTPLGGINGNPELTGTGDAKLWGFFPDASHPRVAQLDKKTGKESTTYSLTKIAGAPSAWAFAFWGGDFWIFLKRLGDASTQVHHLRPASNMFFTPIPNTNRTIVGAGVSTCAPITIM